VFPRVLRNFNSPGTAPELFSSPRARRGKNRRVRDGRLLSIAILRYSAGSDRFRRSPPENEPHKWPLVRNFGSVRPENIGPLGPPLVFEFFDFFDFNHRKSKAAKPVSGSFLFRHGGNGLARGQLDRGAGDRRHQRGAAGAARYAVTGERRASCSRRGARIAVLMSLTLYCRGRTQCETLRRLSVLLAAVLPQSHTENRLERLPELAAELVRLNVKSLWHSERSRRSRPRRPLRPFQVMADAGDPLGSGLVASLARPGDNVTG
jgi:hypothetical protein